eukprot:TRINITY_DN54466_c0_g1_i3.p1 TRINITY_DN54466_c0_g1~~TRINITY_DN54466_c0_g1_i3.p1  ORF type:complete len:210 (-),score=48.88 TRINITY_DN54466_c0_g1_i3:287-916(-)
MLILLFICLNDSILIVHIHLYIRSETFLFFFFFFQAEDGIRDAQESRGLGDVYKRQVHKAAEQSQDRTLIFALDANTYKDDKKGERQSVSGFTSKFQDLGMNSCWGPNPDPDRHTTCNARTYLQPQLNKACRTPERRSDGSIVTFPAKADVNLKDYILFYERQLTFHSTIRDNTGDRVYQEGVFYPTMAFPSDHGITETILTHKQDSQL